MTSHMAIGDGNGGGSHDCIDQAVLAIGERDMIDPNIGDSEHRNSVAVALRAYPKVIHRVSDHPTLPLLDVVDVQSMNDDIPHELQRDLSSMADVNVGATPVYGLIAGDEQLLGEPDVHTAPKDDPERLRLDDGVSQGSGFRVDHVTVGRVGDDVDPAGLAAGGSVGEADGAVGEPLAVGFPVWVASPAFVDGVNGHAWPRVSVAFVS